MSRIGLGVSILAIIIGIVSVLVAPDPHLVPLLGEPQFAMEVVGVLTMATGLFGIVMRAIGKPTKA